MIIEERFERLINLSEAMQNELHQLASELPQFEYELNNIQKKSQEVHRNINHVKRRYERYNNDKGHSNNEKHNVKEKSQRLHAHIQEYKKFMESMEKEDPGFKEYHQVALLLLNQVQDTLQMYWEGKPLLKQETESLNVPSFLMQSKSKPLYTTDEDTEKDGSIPSFLRYRSQPT
jgi:chromosome segregation ATPase